MKIFNCVTRAKDSAAVRKELGRCSCLLTLPGRYFPPVGHRPILESVVERYQFVFGCIVGVDAYVD